MGFSPLGLLLALAVLLPNVVLLVAPPVGGLPSAPVPWVLTALERVGQAACLVVPVITPAGRVSWWWLIPVVALVGAYWALWRRYLSSGRRGEVLYRPVGHVPVPGAIVPVLALVAGAVWLENGWIVLAALVLATGHIPASLLIADYARRAG